MRIVSISLIQITNKYIIDQVKVRIIDKFQRSLVLKLHSELVKIYPSKDEC